MRLRLLVPLAATALAASCQSSSSSSKEQPGAKGVTGQTGTPAEAAKKGGYIVIPSPEPALVNPVLQTAFDLATPLIYEGLVGVDAKFEPQPLLAESWERANDGKTLVFHLRKNV